MKVDAVMQKSCNSVNWSVRKKGFVGLYIRGEKIKSENPVVEFRDDG